MKDGALAAIEAGARLDGAMDAMGLHQRRSVGNMIACRSGALGAQVKRCRDCDRRSCIPHSCRNRSCPRCQAAASLQWLESQRASLLDTRYFHNVFTLPHCLNQVVRQNRSACLPLLFRCVQQTLATFARSKLKASVGVTAVLHTWGQTLCEHYHLHCIVTGGGVSLDGLRWVDAPRSGLFNVKALSLVYRGKFLSGLAGLHRSGKLEFHAKAAGLADPAAFQLLLEDAARRRWVVYSKEPFAGPEQVLKYLSLYTHRVGISDSRILEVDEEKGQVRFAYKDYAQQGRRKTMRLAPGEFLRRFCLHILPARFVKIRHSGILGNRGRAGKVEQARLLIERVRPKAEPRTPPEPEPAKPAADGSDRSEEPCCPHCGSAALEDLEPMRRGACPFRQVVYRVPDTG